MEIWKSVVGFEDVYEVSNYARVRRVPNNGTCLKQWLVNSYWTVKLCDKGRRKFTSVHRIMAQAFIPNPMNLPQINHMDENKSNNDIHNLEWCTQQYNLNYGTARQRGESHRDRKTSSMKSAIKQTIGNVLQIHPDGTVVKKWVSANWAANELGIRQSHIWECLNGKVKTAYGYTWKYADNEQVHYGM